MNTRQIDNPQMESISFNVGMDPNFGNGSPMKLKRKAFVQVVPGTEIEVVYNNNIIYERRFGNNIEPREILVEVKDVEPYPNCNFWVDDRFLLPGNGVQYAQEIEIRTTSPSARIVESTFMDK